MLVYILRTVQHTGKRIRQDIANELKVNLTWITHVVLTCHSYCCVFDVYLLPRHSQWWDGNCDIPQWLGSLLLGEPLHLCQWRIMVKCEYLGESVLFHTESRYLSLNFAYGFHIFSFQRLSKKSIKREPFWVIRFFVSTSFNQECCESLQFSWRHPSSIRDLMTNFVAHSQIQFRNSTAAFCSLRCALLLESRQKITPWDLSQVEF